MKVLIFTILFGLFTVNVFTQQDDMPPPPLIYSAPDKSQIVEFRADRLGFKISFPGKPVETIESFEDENTFIFKRYLNGSNKIVKVTEFGFDKSQNMNAEEIFEQKKLEYLSEENNSLEYEKDISLKNFKGKEFAVKRGYEYQKARVYIAGNKIYEIIIDVTNWHILQNHYKPKVAEFEAETAGFFDSFEIVPVTVMGDKAIIPDKINARKEIIQAPKQAADSFNSRTKIFDSKDGGFKAYFPTKPEKTVKQLDNFFGTSDFVIYMSASPISVYGVSYFDMPTIMTQDFEKTLNYDNQKDVLVNGTGGKLLSENVFEFKEYKGKEFVIFGNNSVITMRTFFVNQRMFRNLVIFPAANEKAALVKVKASQALVKKFFETFAVTELPAPKASVVELPEDFAVKIEDDTFYSGFFDFSIEIPEDFRVLDKEEADFAKNLGLAMSEASTINKDFLKSSYDRTAILLLAMKTGETESDVPQILTIAAESVSTPVFSPKYMADFYLKELVEENESVTKNTQEEIIGGEQFAWVETLDKKDNSRNRVYFANLKGLAFQISYIYTTQEQLNDFLQLLKTISFKKRN